ncbi:fimbrial protein [Phocaeicola barnesiae]|uniref:fimbrial protein n=1 Tax=Phocaeicola barnesiae TaxID=376804 RepID=UPI00037622C2|nr:fimbrial protein [Phocaeicola barnesiae]
MKKFRKYLSVILLMFLTGVMSSCIKDKLPVEADLEKTATVTLRINEPFSSEPLGRSTSPALSDEGIKTLRVIVANANNQVEFNYKHDFSSEANPLIKKTVTFLGMTTGKKKFYVVANEESIGFTDDNYPQVGADISQLFLNTIVKDDNRSFFPKLKEEISTNGLPITGYLEQNIEGDADITISTYHAVAKISLSFINNTGMEIPITGFSLGNFLANKTSLFKEGELLSDIDYSSVKQIIEKTIKTGSYEDVSDNENLLVFYVYETNADPSNYTIALNSISPNVSIGESNQFLDTRDILRNNWIQVIATINLNATEITIDFDFEVRKWDTMDIDVPSFS